MKGLAEIGKVITVFFLYFLVVSSGMYLNGLYNDKILKEQNEQLVVSHVSEVNGNKVEWTKYTNEQYGFSIEYPKSYYGLWGVEMGRAEGRIFFSTSRDRNSNNHTVSFSVNIVRKDTETNSIKSYIKDFEKYSIPNNECEYTISEISIDGATAYMGVYKDRSQHPSPTIYLENSTFIYIINSSSYIPELYEQIFKSFKFLEKPSN